MKSIKLLLTLILLIVCTSFVSASVLVYNQTGTGYNQNFGMNDGNQKVRGSNWTASETFDINITMVMLKKNSAPTGDISLHIYSKDGASPDVSIHTSNEVVTGAGLTTSYQFFNYTFPASTTLTKDVEYVFMLDSSNYNTAPNYFQASGVLNAALPMRNWYGTSDSSWTADAMGRPLTYWIYKEDGEDTNPPLLSDLQCTSCGIANYSAQFTPTINLSATDDTTVFNVCIANNSGYTYEQCTNLGANCTAGDGTNWICTVPTSNQFHFGTNTAYVWGLDSLGNNHTTFNNSITITVPEMSGTCKDSDGNGIEGCNIGVFLNNTWDLQMNTTSGTDGIWMGSVVPGAYKSCATYELNDTWLRGDCQSWRIVS